MATTPSSPNPNPPPAGIAQMLAIHPDFEAPENNSSVALGMNSVSSPPAVQENQLPVAIGRSEPKTLSSDNGKYGQEPDTFLSSTFDNTTEVDNDLVPARSTNQEAASATIENSSPLPAISDASSDEGASNAAAAVWPQSGDRTSNERDVSPEIGVPNPSNNVDNSSKGGRSAPQGNSNPTLTNHDEKTARSGKQPEPLREDTGDESDASSIDSSDSSDSELDDPAPDDAAPSSSRHTRTRPVRNPDPDDPTGQTPLPRIRPAYYYDSSYVPSYPHPGRPDKIPDDPSCRPVPVGGGGRTWTKGGKVGGTRVRNKGGKNERRKKAKEEKPSHAQRGIPVFMPTMEEFQDFYRFVKAVDRYGMKSGIVKVIPPKEWSGSLPSVRENLKNVRLKSAISQHVIGQGGTYKYHNVAKTQTYNVQQFHDMANSQKHRPPDFFGIDKARREQERLDRQAAGLPPVPNGKSRGKGGKGKQSKTESVPSGEPVPETSTSANGAHIGACEDDKKGEVVDEVVMSYEQPGDHPEIEPPADPRTEHVAPDSKDDVLAPTSAGDVAPSIQNNTPSLINENSGTPGPDEKKEKPTAKKKRSKAAELAEVDEEKWKDFDHETFPYGAKKEDYTVEGCRNVERQYWRSLLMGESPAVYGADMQGSLFSPQTTSWNVASLPSYLTHLLPPNRKIPGVNTPYLYFGMWKATFAWHVEDCDLYSINYLHFGAPKFWYAVPQGKGDEMGGAGRGSGGKDRFERVMSGLFPTEIARCPHFLRHKAFLASPTTLKNGGITVNRVVQMPGEFILTYPNGYHAGFNMGFNCAESVNFATQRWVELGRKATRCTCNKDSVSIDVDAMLREHAEYEEKERLRKENKKRHRDENTPRPSATLEGENGQEIGDGAPAPKRKRPSKSGPALATSAMPSRDIPGLSASAGSSAPPETPKLPKKIRKEDYVCALCPDMSPDSLIKVAELEGNPGGAKKAKYAHRDCVTFTPTTYLDHDAATNEDVVMGFDKIEKARWGLKCALCNIKHGAPTQCGKGKCTRAFHASCAMKEDTGVVFDVLIGEGDHAVSAWADRANGVLNPAMEDPNAPMTTVVLCRQHNPEWKKKEADRKVQELRDKIDALTPQSRIRVKAPGAVFEAIYVRNIPNDKKIVCELGDGGGTIDVRWSNVQFGDKEEGKKRKRKEEDTGSEWIYDGPIPTSKRKRSSLLPSAAVDDVANTATISTMPSHSAPVTHPAPSIHDLSRQYLNGTVPPHTGYQSNPPTAILRPSFPQQHPHAHSHLRMPPNPSGHYGHQSPHQNEPYQYLLSSTRGTTQYTPAAQTGSTPAPQYYPQYGYAARGHHAAYPTPPVHGYHRSSTSQIRTEATNHNVSQTPSSSLSQSSMPGIDALLKASATAASPPIAASKLSGSDQISEVRPASRETSGPPLAPS